MRRRKKTIGIGAVVFVVAAAVTAVQATGAFAHGSSTVTIRHQMRGCHTWSFDGSAYKASLRVTVDPARFVRFVNNDVMPHRLIQTSGPKVMIRGANMNRIGARGQILFVRKGVYRFRTKAGEDYPNMPHMHTMGADYVLHMTVVVK
jgi:plastocyanin